MNFKRTLNVKKTKGGKELEKVKLGKVDISVNEMCSVRRTISLQVYIRGPSLYKEHSVFRVATSPQ